MNNVAEYVQTLSDATKAQIIKDYEQFEKDGMIGDCDLRSHAHHIRSALKASDTGITTWMGILTFECLRHFAKEYMQNKGRRDAWNDGFSAGLTAGVGEDVVNPYEEEE